MDISVFFWVVGGVAAAFLAIPVLCVLLDALFSGPRRPATLGDAVDDFLNRAREEGYEEGQRVGYRKGYLDGTR